MPLTRGQEKTKYSQYIHMIRLLILGLQHLQRVTVSLHCLILHQQPGHLPRLDATVHAMLVEACVVVAVQLL